MNSLQDFKFEEDYQSDEIDYALEFLNERTSSDSCDQPSTNSGSAQVKQPADKKVDMYEIDNTILDQLQTVLDHTRMQLTTEDSRIAITAHDQTQVEILLSIDLDQRKQSSASNDENSDIARLLNELLDCN